MAEPTLDPGEKITLRPVTFDEFIGLAAEGTLREERLTTLVLRAKLDPKKMDELRQKFFG